MAQTLLSLKSRNHVLWLAVILAGSLLIPISGCEKAGGPSGIPGDPARKAESPLLRKVPAASSGVDFVNVIQESFELNITTHINTSNGGGVAILDANNDGLPDLYFISTSGENKFYVNEGGLRFRDHTAASGLASAEGFEMAVTAADVNADGFLDLYVTRAGPTADETRRNRLYINNGDLTFSEKAREYGLDDISASSGANFFDYDLDGDLDLYLVNYPVDFTFSSMIQVRPNRDSTDVEPDLIPRAPYDSDRLYRNDGAPKADGSGGFKDVSQAAGIWNFGYGLSVSVEDFNRDGWPDIYIANDFIQPDFLYINNRNGTFTDRLGEYVRHTAQHTMGVDLTDFDNDALFDIMAVDMLSENEYRRKTVISTNSQNKLNSLLVNHYFPPVVRNVLQRNNGNGTFSDVACLAGIFDTDWSWSCLMADLDNDSWKDLLITNGYMRELTDADFINFTWPDIRKKGALQDNFATIDEFLRNIPQYKVNNYFFKNNGDLTFTPVNGIWADADPSWSNGAAYADLDGDGDLDYVVNNIDQEAFLYENLATQQNENHYLQLALRGSPANPFAIGTSVWLYAGSSTQYQYLNPTRGIFSSVDHVLHFGLGAATTIDSLVIRWPGGATQVIQKPGIDKRLAITMDEAARPQAFPVSGPGRTLFQPLPPGKMPAFRHRENDYNDFANTFLLPWAMSDLGPCLEAADIDQDGLTDFFVGNGFNAPCGVFRQLPEGGFRLVSPDTWPQDSAFEDHGALFVDIDMDQDLDLIVVGGGYESQSPEAWTPRLYIQDSPGVFKNARGAMPPMKSVCLRVTSTDFDQDGDIDLIFGGRIDPGRYPMIPESYVLRNDRTKFTDVTRDVAPDFQHCGMITDLQWINLDKDPEPELVVCGEWMPITAFDIRNGRLERMDPGPLGLDRSEGFWNRMLVADLDGDGDPDIVTGNLGLNNPYHTTSRFPIECYAGDFDGNGSIDPIITYYRDDKCYPLVQKDVLIKQVPAMKKKFVFYQDYARATIEDVLTGPQRKEALRLACHTLASGWWSNDQGRFTFHPFPASAQLAPVFGIVAADFNRDGRMDLLLAGNKRSMEVETGPNDSSNGCLLLGGDQGFTVLDNRFSGFWASGEVRDLCYLRAPGNGRMVVVSNNNGPLSVYQLSPE